MGKLYFKNKDYALAENSFIEYLNSSPEDFQTLKLLAQTYEFQKDFSRAFDAYERCYLAEPERKGVLLDICRLLLLNDSSLDHINSRKWLKLAIQYFPSNPIVANLKQSLPIDQTHSKSSFEEEILAKLESIEKRLEQVEIGIKKISQNHVPLTQPDRPPANDVDQLFKLEQLKICKPAGQMAPTTGMHNSVKYDEPKFSELPTPKLEELRPPRVEAPKPAEPEPLTTLEQKSPKPVDFKAFNSGALNLSASTESSLFNSQTLNLSKTIETRLFNSDDSKSPRSSETKSVAPKPEPVSSLFNFGNPTTGNFFANSIAKFNIDSNKSEFGIANSNPSTFGNAGTGISAFSTTGANFPSFANTGSSISGSGLANTSISSFAKIGTINDKSGEGDAAEDDDGPVKTEELPIEDNCDMKPIEVKSGEEDEDVLFRERCKLFRFRDKEYKERGLGDMKVLKHRETGKGRLIMRRELINLVCLNCWSCSNVDRIRETQIKFTGTDASDGEPEMSIFIARFKKPEMADEFEKLLKELLVE